MIDPGLNTTITSDLTADSGRRRRLLPDYNRAAVAYWWLLTIGGALALAWSIGVLATLPSPALWQIVAGTLVAAIVGMFPLQVPRTKTSFAAADIFIFLLLMVYGPFAAVLAAAAESASCAWRTSSRWSSRIVGPAASALAMLACGHAFVWFAASLAQLGLPQASAAVGAALAFAVLYFLVSPILVTTVIYLKRRRGPTLTEWLTTFGWLGMGYLASASIASVLYIALGDFGPTMLFVAMPMIGMFVVTLRFYYAQQESAQRAAEEQASRERAETAARESAMASQHLRELEVSDRRFQSAFDRAAIGMALVAEQGGLVQVNAALCVLLGCEAPALANAQLVDLVHPDDAPMLQQQLRRLRDGSADGFQCELRFMHAHGHDVRASIHGSNFAPDVSTGPCLIVQAFDVSARFKAEERLQHMAYHDSLTGLANRRRLQDSVTQAIDELRAGEELRFSVMHLNFDRFKQLSDSFGRGVGDQFLVVVARRIHGLMRPGDLLARLEGDDFGILARHRVDGALEAHGFARRLQQVFAAPIRLNDTEVHTHVSIGITSSDTGYTLADDTLRDADLAMSKARADGKGRIVLFDASLHERASQLLQLETDLRRALDGHQLSLAYQPVYGIAPRRIVGFEALARWTHPAQGVVSPAEFIPVAEASGLIVPLTRWAVTEACRQLQEWRQLCAGAEQLFVNVNIAGQDLCEIGFADFVRDQLDAHQLPAHCLTLEITETALMQQLELGARTLARLRDIGVGLSVDDFGTGYSSLSHLSSLPINSLKIDRGFVNKLDGVSVESEIVRAVLQLGHALDKRVIAEGIETPAQLERLQSLGCRYAQGYLLARPLPAGQVAAMLPSVLAQRARGDAADDDALPNPVQVPALQRLATVTTGRGAK